MIRHLRQPVGERVRMQRAHGRKGAKDDQVERALQQLDRFLTSTWHASEGTALPLDCQVKLNALPARRRCRGVECREDPPFALTLGGDPITYLPAETVNLRIFWSPG